jgi:hypothetical protein
MTIILFSSIHASFSDEAACFRQSSVKSEVLSLVSSLACLECYKIQKKTCPSYAIEGMPKIYIIGENHIDKNSSIIKASLIALAKRGEIVLLTEPVADDYALPWIKKSSVGEKNDESTYYSNGKNGLLFGIESVVVTPLLENYFIIFNYLNREKSALQTVVDYFSQAEKHPIINGSINGLTYDLLLRDKIPLLRFLYENNNNPGSKEYHEALNKISERDLVLFIEAIHKSIIDKTKENFKDDLYDYNIPYTLSLADAKKFGILSSAGHSNGNFRALIIGLRNLHFAKSANDMFCKIAKKNKDIFILVGDDHSRGVKSLLEGLGHYNYSIEHMRSFVPKDAEKTLKILFKNDAEKIMKLLSK